MQAVLASPWWVLLLAGFGVVSLGALILNLFTAIGDRPRSASATDSCEAGDDEFLRALSGALNSPLQSGGTAKLLNNGDEYLPAMIDAMRAARHSINFTNYIWEPGRMSDRLFDVLVERARAGVAVRVLMDGIGGFRARHARVAELREAGGQWVWFNPPRFGHLTRLHKRNHRRALVVDGRIGYTGGMAVGDKWLGNAQDPDHWRDSMVEVRGPIAVNLQAAFAQIWSDATGEMLVGPKYFPADLDPEQPLVGQPISRHINVVSSPSKQAHPLRRLFWLSLRAARERAYITNPYFVPDDAIRDVLQERARAGVDVRVLVPNEYNDVPLIRWASHSHYDSLLAAGVRIYEYQPTMIHQKIMVVDGRWSVVGSANLDVRSKELNQENVLGIVDTGFARELEQVFLADLENAREVHLDGWRRRPLWARIPERFCRMFEEQF